MSGVGVTKVHSINQSSPRSRISNLINHLAKNKKKKKRSLQQRPRNPTHSPTPTTRSSSPRIFSQNQIQNSMASLPLSDAPPATEEVSSPAAKKIKLADARDSHAGVADIKPEYLPFTPSMSPGKMILTGTFFLHTDTSFLKLGNPSPQMTTQPRLPTITKKQRMVAGGKNVNMSVVRIKRGSSISQTTKLNCVTVLLWFRGRVCSKGLFANSR